MQEDADLRGRCYAERVISCSHPWLDQGLDRGIQMFSESLIEEIIREAMEKGEFDNLPGKGKPLDLEAYFATPADVRLGYSVLKSAGCLPMEVELQKEIESLKARLAACDDQLQQQALSKEIAGKTLKLNLMLDSNQRARSEQGRKD